METSIKEIEAEAISMQLEFNRLFERNVAWSYHLERWANRLFIASVFGIFISIFSQVWIGICALILAFIGSALLIYKVRAKLSEKTDVYIWLAGRCWQLARQCTGQDHSEASVRENTSVKKQQDDDNQRVYLLMKQLKQIAADQQIYESGQTNALLNDYFANRYDRNKQSSKLKHKYGKHEIKQYI